MRLRFFGAMRSIPPRLAARLSQIDYDREMALVAIAPATGDQADEIVGVVRLIGDPDNIQGEFAVMVRTDQKGLGLGYAPMEQMLAWARSRGLARVAGEVLPENATMLDMAGELGASIERGQDGKTMHVTFDLAARAAAPASV
jgi:acetyltransferase